MGDEEDPKKSLLRKAGKEAGMIISPVQTLPTAEDGKQSKGRKFKKKLPSQFTPSGQSVPLIPADGNVSPQPGPGSRTTEQEPFLEQIFNGIGKLNSQQQELMRQIKGMEDRIARALDAPKKTAAVDVPKHAIAVNAPKKSVALAMQAPETRRESRVSTTLRETANRRSISIASGQLSVKVSVQLPDNSAWQCPKESTEVHTESNMVAQRSRKSRKPDISPSKISVRIRSAKGLKKSDLIGNSDPYCICALSCDGQVHQQFRTRVMNNTCEPGWNEEFLFEGFGVGSTICFSVKDSDKLDAGDLAEDEPLGNCSLSWDQFYPLGFHGVMQLYEGDSVCLLPTMTDEQLSPGVIKLVDQLKAYETTTNDEQLASAGMSWAGLLDMDAKEKAITLDVIMGVLIFLQTVFIGISMDYEYNYFIVFDILFLVCFCIEAYLKIRMYTPWGYFTRPWFCFDFCLILMDLTQMILSSILKTNASDNQTIAIFRMVRFVRLARLFRVVDLEVQMLKDMVAMIGGILGGTPTLLSAIALFLLVVFMTSLFFREFFGQTPKIADCEECGDIDITEYFGNVPRAMLTVFRFFFGDFSTIQGVNLYEAIQVHYGTGAQLFVCLVFFFVMIGVFNVITAIFVESTLAAAATLDRKKLLSRLSNSQLWIERIHLLINKFFDSAGKNDGRPLSVLAGALAAEPIYEHQFQDFIKDDMVRQALDDLDIDGVDHAYLFDILDADNCGNLFLDEFIDGLSRLRGMPRRSDTIIIDLMVREVQKRTHSIEEGMNSLMEKLLEQERI
jgi:hypothetical protein